MSFNADDYLAHHGILGQKWGVRRFQNADGSLTEAGRKRYFKSGDGSGPRTSAGKKAVDRAYDNVKKAYKVSEYADRLEPEYREFKAAEEKWQKQYDGFKNSPSDDPEFKKHINAALKDALKYFDSDEYSNMLESYGVTDKKMINEDRQASKQLYKDEANNAFNGYRTGNQLVQDAYNRYIKANNLYKTEDDYFEARKKYDEAVTSAAKESYKAGGKEAYDMWIGLEGTDLHGNLYLNKPGYDSEEKRLANIAYMIKTEHKKRYTKSDSLSHSYDDILEHHGIKGQKWGVRRFQNPDGSLTVEGRKRYLTGDFKKKVSDFRKKSSQKISEVRKKMSERRAAKEEADKNEAIAKGDANKIYKYADKMSTNEINEAINRASAMKRLAELQDKSSLVEKAANTAERLSNYGNKFLNLATTVKKINEFNKKEEKPDKDYEDYMKTVKKQALNAANEARNKTEGSDSKKEHAAATAYESMMKNAKESYKKVEKGKFYKEKTSDKKEDKPKENTVKKMNEKVESLSEKSVADRRKELSTSANRMNARLADINKSEGWTSASSMDDILRRQKNRTTSKAIRGSKRKFSTTKISNAKVNRIHYAD